MDWDDCMLGGSSISCKHGLRTPYEAFFHWNSELFGLGRQIGQINFWGFAVFSAKLSAPNLGQWVPCPCFSLFNQYFYKKLDLYIHILNIYLGLGLELDFVRVSVVRGCKLVNAFKLCCNNLPSHLNDHQSSKKFDYTSSYLLEGAI